MKNVSSQRTVFTIDPAQAVPDHVHQERWLKTYYFARAAFAIAWVAIAATAGQHSAAIGAALLVIYPAFDALANLVDGSRSGGLAKNRTQAVNVAASLAITAAVVVALPDMHHVLAIFGAWAILSGLLQLGTGLRRWKEFGAQWAMILSGGQSALAGGFFIFQAQQSAMPSVATVAGYAGFGAFYFLVSGVSLSVRAWRRDKA
jgi:uncharacterized membrane protein HdeD (DUF308 family)